jgi:uncharacterized membrane protein
MKQADRSWLRWYATSIVVAICGFVTAILAFIQSEKTWHYALSCVALACFTRSAVKIISLIPQAKQHYANYKTSRK